MKLITDQQQDIAKQYTIGGKASGLYRLKEMDLAVPKWIVIPAEELVATDLQQVDNYSFSSSLKEIITNYFKDISFFAVRSSAIDEDGTKFSFAGQFESRLFVTKETLEENIKQVWRSAFSERVVQYRKHHNLKQQTLIAIIIQEMINADVSGVAFGINPVNGNTEEKMINAVYGLGEGLVSGELDADNFIVSNNKIDATPTDKMHRLTIDSATEGGTKKIIVDEDKRNKASLSDKHIFEIASILDLCEKTSGKPQDIEFSIANDRLYILQARPITAIHRSGEYILWDNSNIIESYPGVTTPLTFSFISQSYETAYKLFSEFMGVEPAVIKEHERIFANTLGLINGRVYYNLKTWYQMLALLPGYSINARFMEKMMGVKERFDLPGNYRLSKHVAWWRILKMIVKMYTRFLSLPKKRTAFVELVDNTIASYKKIDYASKSANDLMHLYLAFEKKLLNEWKAPLLNDFFAMIWFGLLQKRCEKYTISSNPNIHNDLLCGSSDIISTQPVHRSIAIATFINSNTELKNMFLSLDEKTILQKLSHNKDEASLLLKNKIDQYIADFGERCIGELKLETISYTQDPATFIRLLKNYVTSGITAENISGKTEEAIRQKAEAELNAALKAHPFKKRKLKRTIRRTRELVSSRENLRYERTRAFGTVREIFSQIGKVFYTDGIIENERDIFYLTKEEIFSFIEGASVSQNIKALVALRRSEFDSYKKMDAPAERFATYGPVYHKNDFFSTGKIEKITGDLKGIGCCPGIVRAKVNVITDPSSIQSLNGDILVTTSTDPGWVTLFPSAAGIIVERGSLLSHSAIVAREMGIPCIVSVTGLLKTLQTGDEIEMNGSTGTIRIINKLS